jgi:hypothetical protein
MYVGKNKVDVFGIAVASGQVFTVTEEQKEKLLWGIEQAKRLGAGATAIIIVSERDDVEIEQKEEQKSDVVETSESAIDYMSFFELRTHIKNKGIKYNKKMTKNELLEFIKTNKI